MTRRLIPLLAVLAFLPSLAQASAPADSGAASSFKLQPIAVPIIVKGRLINYVFVNLQLNLDPKADGDKAKLKEPFIRDALVRALHRTPVTYAADYSVVDETKLKATLLTAANGVLGPKQATSVVLLSQIPRQKAGFPAVQP